MQLALGGLDPLSSRRLRSRMWTSWANPYRRCGYLDAVKPRHSRVAGYYDGDSPPFAARQGHISPRSHSCCEAGWPQAGGRVREGWGWFGSVSHAARFLSGPGPRCQWRMPGHFASILPSALQRRRQVRPGLIAPDQHLRIRTDGLRWCRPCVRATRGNDAATGWLGGHSPQPGRPARVERLMAAVTGQTRRSRSS